MLRDTIKCRLRPCSWPTGPAPPVLCKDTGARKHHWFLCIGSTAMKRRRHWGTLCLTHETHEAKHASKNTARSCPHECWSERSRCKVASTSEKAFMKAGAERPVAGLHALEIRSFKRAWKTGLLQNVFKAGYRAPETLWFYYKCKV